MMRKHLERVQQEMGGRENLCSKIYAIMVQG